MAGQFAQYLATVSTSDLNSEDFSLYHKLLTTLAASNFVSEDRMAIVNCLAIFSKHATLPQSSHLAVYGARASSIFTSIYDTSCLSSSCDILSKSPETTVTAMNSLVPLLTDPKVVEAFRARHGTEHFFGLIESCSATATLFVPFLRAAAAAFRAAPIAVDERFLSTLLWLFNQRTDLVCIDAILSLLSLLVVAHPPPALATGWLPAVGSFLRRCGDENVLAVAFRTYAALVAASPDGADPHLPAVDDVWARATQNVLFDELYAAFHSLRFSPLLLAESRVPSAAIKALTSLRDESKPTAIAALNAIAADAPIADAFVRAGAPDVLAHEMACFATHQSFGAFDGVLALLTTLQQSSSFPSKVSPAGRVLARTLPTLPFAQRRVRAAIALCRNALGTERARADVDAADMISTAVGLAVEANDVVVADDVVGLVSARLQFGPLVDAQKCTVVKFLAGFASKEGSEAALSLLAQLSGL